MTGTLENNIYIMLAAILFGYLLGSIPVAAWVSRSRGVDIFSTGSRLAGAANVARNVGRRYGLMVLLGDAAKGVLTVMAARQMGLQDGLLLPPVMAALVGHWRSAFTRFRGGDGLATLLGVTLVAVPVLVVAVGIVTGAIAWLAVRSIIGHQPTLWGAAVGYGSVLVQAVASNGDATLPLGVGIMAMAVLVHAAVGHRRRAASAAHDLVEPS